ncbi:MAG: sulfate transporter CysZ [Planctomycetota bacterium]
MLADLLRGAGLLFQGFALLRRPGIRRYAFAPMILAGVALALVVALAANAFTPVVEWLHAFLPAWLQWLEAVLWILFAAGVALGLVLLYATVAGLVAAPFNGLLAAAVEAQQTGRPPPDEGWRAALLGLPRTLVSEASKVLYALAWTLVALLLFVIPGVNVVAPAFWLLSTAWILAFSFADYALSNHRISLRQSRALLRRRRGLALGFGGAVTACFAVPILNVLALPAAVCGGALLALQVRQGPAGVEPA